MPIGIRRWLSVGLVSLCALIGGLILASLAAAQGTGSPSNCPNEQLRAEQPYGLGLPDCRAYEMVSPLETNGQDATDWFSDYVTRAAASGEAITYPSRGSFADPAGSVFENQFLSQRTPDGWSTQSITMPEAAVGNLGLWSQYANMAFTPELSEGVAETDLPPGGETPAGLSELYLVDFANATYRWVSTSIPSDERPYHSAYQYGLLGASTDLSHLFFSYRTGGPVYEWLEGKVALASLANNGETMPAQANSSWHVVSSNGSRFFFTSPLAPGLIESNEGEYDHSQLYVRENAEEPQSPMSGEECTVAGDACTVEVSASQRSNAKGEPEPDPSGPQPAAYVGASADGSKVFFTSDQELTTDSNTGVAKRQEILVQDASGGTYTLSFKGQTTAPIPYDATFEEVQSALEVLSSIGVGNVSASAARGGFVVVFEGGLAGSQQPSLTADSSLLTGGGAVSVKFLARPGNDLYEYDLVSGKLTDLSVDTVELTDGADVQGVVQISDDGAYVYFVADGDLAAGAVAGQPNLYVSHEGGASAFIGTLSATDAADWSRGTENNTAVVTPDGTRLAFVSGRELTGYDNQDANTGEPDSEVYLYNAELNRLVCSSCNPSGAQPIGSSGFTRKLDNGGYRSRELSEDGTVFFNSSDALVPYASDGRQNVYEYEDGHIYPISDVAGGYESFFLDASANGENVFFGTADQLLPQDTSNNVVVYDARVDGGFPVTISPSPCDNGDSCKPPSTPQPAIFGAPGSATFSGVGNIAPVVVTKPTVKPRTRTLKCKKGHVKAKDKCVKKARSTKKARKSSHGKGSR